LRATGDGSTGEVVDADFLLPGVDVDDEGSFVDSFGKTRGLEVDAVGDLTRPVMVDTDSLEGDWARAVTNEGSGGPRRLSSPPLSRKESRCTPLGVSVTRIELEGPELNE
jgi:hypothetical protein